MKLMKLFGIILLVLSLSLSAVSCSGDAPYIGENGNWFVDGEDTGVSATGKDGASPTVESIDKISSVGNVDTYEITFSTGDKVQFGVENGVDGEDGITPTVTECVAIGTSEEMTVYRITFSTGLSTTFEIKNGKDGKDGVDTTEDLGIIYSLNLGNKFLAAQASELIPGSSLKIASNTIIKNKHLVAKMELDSIGDGVIRIGHGYTEYAATYIEIDKENLKVVKYYTSENIVEQKYVHGLNIKDFLTVNIDVGAGYANIQIMTSSGFMYTVKNVSWDGRQGSPHVEAVSNVTLKNVSLKWNCDDYSSKVWMVGDSYFNVSDPSRWPSHLLQSGYTDNLMMGYPGMASSKGIAEFEAALHYGTPVYAFWCMGMNDMDGDNSINSNWLSATERFIELCEARGIEVILSTIPSTPTRNNRMKNEWVRNSGYRYVDFDKAVVANQNTGEWYFGMLYKDNVHPAKSGAQALYMQVLIDFPEIMCD